MDNNELVVGTKDCPLNTVIKIVRISPAIQDEWSTFARGLDVSSTQIKRLRQNLLHTTITHEDVIVEALEIWIAKNASEATLLNLLQVVEGDCGANDVGETLRLEYKLPCKKAEDNPSIEWKELSPAFQKRLKETFQYFTPNLNFSKVLPKLAGASLVSLMRGKKPHVLSLPEELSYYVSRTVVTRNIISDKIFHQNSPDIFLFSGMDRYELSKLAKDKLSSSSRQQLQSVNVNFMILDQDNHFERICGKTNHPVHWLRKDVGGKLRWMKSNGEMGNLRNYIDHMQDEMEEEQFCQMCTSRSLPVLICDNPGMGKSALLSQLGHRLLQLHPERTISFIMLSKFIEYVKSLKIEDKLKIIELTLQNWTEVGLEQSKMDDSISIELLLDGYDEVESADRKLCLEILQTIRKSFKSIRLWITSRPHLMEELENALNVLGYKIRPFGEQNQVQFLSSFWSRKMELDQQKVQLFGGKCLKSLKSTMKNPTDNDIAGLPLQCLLIGEVYEDDAVEYAKVNNNKPIESCAPIEIEIGTITNLYRQLIKKKLEKYKSAFGRTKLKDDDLMSIHAHLALEELFPVEHASLNLTKAAKMDLEEVVKGGILTATATGGVTFLHRTFAEYFVAWFIVDTLRRGRKWRFGVRNLYVRIMSCSIPPNETKFSHPVICYFLDSMLANIRLGILPNNFPSKLNPKQVKFVKNIAFACIGGNFVQIFKLFDTRGVFDMLPSKVFNLDPLLLAVRNSSVELVKSVLARFEGHHNFDLEVQKATLREAVRQGKFPILEFLIKEQRLRGIVENFNEDTNLVCDCVTGTSGSLEEEIKERILVLQTLVEIKGSLVDGLNDSSTTAPLLSKDVHMKLLIELVRLGANVVVQNHNGESVLFLDRPVSPEDYHNLVMSIPTDKLKKIINFEGGIFSPSALQSILKTFDPLPVTLDIFHGVGANFYFHDDEDNSVLAQAIRDGRNAETIRKLIQLGARVKRHSLGFLRPFRSSNLLHIAVVFGNVDAVGVLLDECKINLSAMDENGRTPLDLAINIILDSSSSEECEKFSELARILIERGGRVKKSTDSIKKSLLHNAVENYLEPFKLLVQLGIYKVEECERRSLSSGDRYSIIQHLLEKGANPTSLNYRNQTSFHAFLRNKEGHDFKIFQLFKSKWDKRSLWTPAIATLALGYAVAGEDTFPDKEVESLARECEAHGANFNWSDDYGNSLLHLAAKNGKANTVKFLIQKGFIVNSKNNSTESPLHLAASSNQNGGLEVVKCLLENGGNPTEINYWGENILHSGAHGRVDTLKYLLGVGGADVNGKDQWGYTPLHEAVQAENQSKEIDCLEKCTLLIQHGADVNIMSHKGKTPMEMARDYHSTNWTLIELFKSSEGPPSSGEFVEGEAVGTSDDRGGGIKKQPKKPNRKALNPSRSMKKRR